MTAPAATPSPWPQATSSRAAGSSAPAGANSIKRAGVAGTIIKTSSGILRCSPLMDVIRDLAAEMKGYESEMGFTPASRSRVSVAPREPSASDPWSEIAG